VVREVRDHYSTGFAWADVSATIVDDPERHVIVVDVKAAPHFALKGEVQRLGRLIDRDHGHAPVFLDESAIGVVQSVPAVHDEPRAGESHLVPERATEERTQERSVAHHHVGLERVDP
jgi:hypothetical protein